MNPFVYKSAAIRYAKGRPFFHPLVISRIRDYLVLNLPVATVLDVGCGTGLSSVALLEISMRIVGLDSSADMVAHAPRDSRIDYAVASAEHLPFPNDTFDMITLGQVIHWLDSLAFLSEAKRVSRPGSWLIIYDNFFVSHQPKLGTDFQNWFDAISAVIQNHRGQTYA